jgi:hypothetical protein
MNSYDLPNMHHFMKSVQRICEYVYIIYTQDRKMQVQDLENSHTILPCYRTEK